MNPVLVIYPYCRLPFLYPSNVSQSHKDNKTRNSSYLQKGLYNAL